MSFKLELVSNSSSTVAYASGQLERVDVRHIWNAIRDYCLPSDVTDIVCVYDLKSLLRPIVVLDHCQVLEEEEVQGHQRPEEQSQSNPDTDREEGELSMGGEHEAVDGTPGRSGPVCTRWRPGERHH